MQTFIQSRIKLFSMVAVMLSIFLAALDQTIVATALPKIVQEFNGLEHISWIFTSYMLASTVTVPVYGKLSDIYGRKYFFIGGIFIFLLGSFLCGFANSMIQLIIFRGIQGIGSGAIFVNAFAIIGDIFPPKERGKWQGLIGASFGMASIIGPLAGGFLTDNFTWRWVFYVNIPLGILAMLIIYFTIPKIVHSVKDRSIDWWGALSITLGLTLMLLGFVWGGNQYPWTSWQIIGLFLGALTAFAVFIFLERKTEEHEPILPLSLFKNKTFAIATPIVFLTGAALFGATLYIPLFAQDVIRYSATNSGLILTPFMLSFVFASAISGQIVSRTGKYKTLTIFGLELVTIGLFLFSRINNLTTSGELIRDMIITGAGMGMSFPTMILAIQNAFPQNKLGVTTATTQLFRSVGGTVGVAIFGSILNNRLLSNLGNISSDPFLQTANRLNPHSNFGTIDVNKIQGILSPDGRTRIEGFLSKAPATFQEKIMNQYHVFINKLANALATSIADIYILATLLMGVAVVLSFFLPEVNLRASHEQIGEKIGKELEDEFGETKVEDEQPQSVFESKKSNI